MTTPDEPPISITLSISARTARHLAALTGGDFGPEDIESVICKLIDHAQQGVYRPGANEREWVCQMFGYDWPANVEPDADGPRYQGKPVFDRPREREAGSG